MVDDDAWQQIGTRRPVADALATAMHRLAGFTSARFTPPVCETAVCPAWPDDATAYTPNWQIYQVTVDRPGQQRVTVLSNGDAATTTVGIRRLGATAQTCQMDGAAYPLASAEQGWVLARPGAAAHFQLSDPDGYHYIGASRSSWPRRASILRVRSSLQRSFKRRETSRAAQYRSATTSRARGVGCPMGSRRASR
jgi:hypothetical protein